MRPNCWCYPSSTMSMSRISYNLMKTNSCFRMPPWYHKSLAINHLPVYRDDLAWTKKSRHSNGDAWMPTWTCICSDAAVAMTTCSFLIKSARNANYITTISGQLHTRSTPKPGKPSKMTSAVSMDSPSLRLLCLKISPFIVRLTKSLSQNGGALNAKQFRAWQNLRYASCATSTSTPAMTLSSTNS